MKRGPIIHGVLLVAALIFAFQTWTREAKVERKTGEFQIWSMPQESIAAVVYDTENRSVRVERRKEGNETYFWGNETRSTTKPPATTPEGEPSDGSVPETKTETREFAVGETGQAMIEHMADLRALRDLGQPSDEDLKEYELTESKDNITVSFDGGSRSLVIGGKIFGGSDRYVRDPESGRAYVVAGAVLKDLMAGESGLRLRKLHAYGDDEIAKATVSAGGKTRELVRMTVEDEKGVKSKNWADAVAADKPDQTMSNFVQSLDKLTPTRYEPEVDPSTLTLKVRLEHKRTDGSILGWLELYEKAPEPAEAGDTSGSAAPAADPAKDATGKPAADPAASKEPAAKPPSRPATQSYYVRTELTRTFASVAPGAATRITEDIAQVFAQ